MNSEYQTPPSRPSYIVGLKAGESSDTSFSTCDGVGHIPGHWKINKRLAPLLLIGGGSGYG